MQTCQCLRYLTEFLESVSEPFHPHIYLREALGHSFALDYNNGNTISIMRLYKCVGCSSDLKKKKTQQLDDGLAFA